jgi:hypothetical protein
MKMLLTAALCLVLAACSLFSKGATTPGPGGVVSKTICWNDNTETTHCGPCASGTAAAYIAYAETVKSWVDALAKAVGYQKAIDLLMKYQVMDCAAKG